MMPGDGTERRVFRTQVGGGRRILQRGEKCDQTLPVAGWLLHGRLQQSTREEGGQTDL